MILANTLAKIVFMGTPDFAVPSLEGLIEAGYEIAGVVTQPDRKKGRGQSLAFSPVKTAALKNGLTVYQPEKVREDGFFETLCSLKPDVIIVVAFGQLIPQRILSLPRCGCINVHASLLPKYRGAAPIQHALLDGEKETGVTIMQMGPGLDTGDIISCSVTEITSEDTGGSLFDRLAEDGAKLLVRTLPSILDGTADRIPQPEESPTPYASMLTRQMGELDFSRPAPFLERLVRGMNPWPGAYTTLHGKTLKVYRSLVAENVGDVKASPGSILSTRGEGILVSCGEGALSLVEIQLEGKKRMDARAFLRGYELREGEKLGREV
ncbi:MAG: methionyl-tRNA formyltransferase [Blautia sp.]|nr:methionyl-tRNA formyltransferase [Blautia sp.]